MSDSFTPIRGKCMWWREAVKEEDVHDVRLREDEKRVDCTCFVEGKGWAHTRGDLPPDCPENKHCRYYIKHW